MLLRSFAQPALEKSAPGDNATLPTFPSHDAQGWVYREGYTSTENSGTILPGRATLADWHNMPQHTQQHLKQISRLDMAFRSLGSSYDTDQTLLYIALEDPEDKTNQRVPETQAGAYGPAPFRIVQRETARGGRPSCSDVPPPSTAPHS